KENGKWMIELPNGTYELTVSIGDAVYPTGDKGKLVLEANGVTVYEFADGERIGVNEFKQSTVEVKVTDGLLTLDPLDTAHKNIKMNYLHLTSIALDEPVVEETPAAEEPAAPSEPSTGQDSGSSGGSSAPTTPNMPKTGMGGTS